MAPQPSSQPPEAAMILGAIGTFVGAYRIYKNWRRHSTEGVPGWMVLLWASAMPLFGAYCLIQNLNRAIQVQPHLFCFLCLVCWGQTLYYAHKYKPWQAGLIVLATGTSFGAFELILIFTLQIPYRKGIDWPVTALGIISGIMINLGLVAPYIDAAKRDWRIIGISFRFLSIDFAGAIFSLLSLCFQTTIDRPAAASYIAVIAMEIGICTIQCLWICRNWTTLKEARKEGKSFDEFTGLESEAAKRLKQPRISKEDDRNEYKRRWSFSAIFAAMNRRHDERHTVEDIENGNAHIVTGENKSNVCNRAIVGLDHEVPRLPPMAFILSGPRTS